MIQEEGDSEGEEEDEEEKDRRRRRGSSLNIGRVSNYQLVHVVNT